MNVNIIGAGIGGLVLALELHRQGIQSQVYEAVEQMESVGVGINVLPHATRTLARLGLEEELARVGVATQEQAFFTRFGQLIYREPAGQYAGYDYPQFSIHRGQLQACLLHAVIERLGGDAVSFGHRCARVEQDADRASVEFELSGGGTVRERAHLVVGCDGVHSAVRQQFHPNEGEPVYSGKNMWRGVTQWSPFLTGASMVRAGWFDTGKLVAYPIRPVDSSGRQLVNWVAEVETPRHHRRAWNTKGRLEDFIGYFEDWHFDWLNVPDLLRATKVVLEYPMVDQEPLESWGSGRVTLLGDAAHPMVPRGSNGAGQAILDAQSLAAHLVAQGDPEVAVRAYEQERIPATARVVLANRQAPPDIILDEVRRRTGDAPFENIDEVIRQDELESFTHHYKEIAGYTKEDVSGR